MTFTLVLSVSAVLLLIGLLLRVEYRQWREATERERFMLALKEASTPRLMLPEDLVRLKRLRAPFRAVWRWLPDLWQQPEFSKARTRGR
jgi:hypothetical protein